MAGPVGRITAALATVHNENSAALANLNFDFTLVKLDAPIEYTGLGTTISQRRKIDAEEGTLHKTARKLGALFTGVLPHTEELFRAYGTRVSEVSSMPTINPREASDMEGIFANHVGADTTSIWAAVTSGSAAIAVHLLACMLARMFTYPPEAISIWVELVQKRKEEICAQNDDGLYSYEQQAERSASQQEVSRAELAIWDASARAWLQSADQAKELQHKQTMLILNNASVSVNNEPETYPSVMKAWTVALEAMNSLVKGIPQRVQDGAALLAISSWHLYPDMIVYGSHCVEVKQKDSLFKGTALLTLGLQHVRDDTKSVYWSLPLACLQYYGHPIRASRTAGQENSRVTYQQFSYVLLGCVFAGWKEFAPTNEEGILWMQMLRNILELSSSTDPNKPKWLNYLLDAVWELEDCDESEIKVAQQLINLGRRRSTFLHAHNKTPPPLFALCEVSMLLPALKSSFERVQLLRELCSQVELKGSDFLISYQSSDGQHPPAYASLIPVKRVQPKRMRDGTLKRDCHLPPKHVRWITLSSYQLSICQQVSCFNDLEGARKLLDDLESLEQIDATARSNHSYHGFGIGQDQDITPERQQRLFRIRELTEAIIIGRRKQDIEDIGEICLPVAEWDIDPQHGFHEKGLIFSSEEDFSSACAEILQKLSIARSTSVATSKTFYAGDPNLAALYSITPTPIAQYEVSKLRLSPKRLKSFFEANKFDTERLYAHFSLGAYPDQRVHEEIANLRACSLMAELYKLLPGATVSTLVVSQSLTRAKWLPGSHHATTRGYNSTFWSLPQAFACVAMFETGTCNIDPGALSEVFAMSSGNSLFVAGALLCDPFEEPSSTEIRRVIGNIGRAGITFLIPPPEVKTKVADPEKWMAINHDIFNGKLENSFLQTSIHLSFTEYEISLITEDNPRHIIDRAAVLVETLISVYDGGTWVAEVDILKAFKSKVLRATCSSAAQLKPVVDHKVTYKSAKEKHSQLGATSVDNWDELIEAPCAGVIAVRAHKNWLARLAATALCVKHGFKPVILPEEPCWICCAGLIGKDGSERIALIC